MLDRDFVEKRFDLGAQIADRGIDRLRRGQHGFGRGAGADGGFRDLAQRR